MIKVDYDSVAAVNSIDLRLDIQKSGDEYYCQGVANASVKLVCARCLAEFDLKLSNSTDFIICSREWHENNRDAIDNEDYVYLQGGDLTADLTDIVRQTLITALDLKPLCSEGCRGICCHCGADLNHESCSCHQDKTDTRWEGLKQLSHIMKENKGITDASS
ncbi:MAG: DUF177 domain-containing protein [Candidatus Zixiibacteriota bacterium]